MYKKTILFINITITKTENDIHTMIFLNKTIPLVLNSVYKRNNKTENASNPQFSKCKT